MASYNFFIVGASGLIGSSLFGYIQSHFPHDLTGTYHKKPQACLLPFDLAIDYLPVASNDSKNIVFFCSAMTSLAQVFQQQQQAYQTNVIATINVMEDALTKGWSVQFISSDKVYGDGDGDYKETDQLNPITVYGKYKAEVEQWLLKNAPEQMNIFRLSKVFGYGKNDLMAAMVHQLGSHQSIKCAVDQLIQPTLVDDVTKVLLKLSLNQTGVWNVANSDIHSRLAMAEMICKHLNIGMDLLEKVKINDLGLAEKQPRDCSMNTTKLQSAFVTKFTSFDESVETFIKNNDRHYL
ncbi:MAG: sugar nucleotide-binding protein [Methylococcales bacterium]|nr:sugar nucleotide-binding protein [Methylococcales bacterium]